MKNIYNLWDPGIPGTCVSQRSTIPDVFASPKKLVFQKTFFVCLNNPCLAKKTHYSLRSRQNSHSLKHNKASVQNQNFRVLSKIAT